MAAQLSLRSCSARASAPRAALPGRQHQHQQPRAAASGSSWPHERAAAPRRGRQACRAAEGDGGASPAPESPQPAASEQQPQQPQQQPQPSSAPPSAPLLAKGQGTAIVTGAISVIFGVAYLVLVQLLDMRGGELQPPPPEAFIP